MLDKVKIITKIKYISPQHCLNVYQKLSVNEKMNIIQVLCDLNVLQKD